MSTLSTTTGQPDQPQPGSQKPSLLNMPTEIRWMYLVELIDADDFLTLQLVNREMHSFLRDTGLTLKHLVQIEHLPNPPPKALDDEELQQRRHLLDRYRFTSIHLKLERHTRDPAHLQFPKLLLCTDCEHYQPWTAFVDGQRSRCHEIVNTRRELCVLNVPKGYLHRRLCIDCHIRERINALVTLKRLDCFRYNQRDAFVCCICDSVLPAKAKYLGCFDVNKLPEKRYRTYHFHGNHTEPPESSSIYFETSAAHVSDV